MKKLFILVVALLFAAPFTVNAQVLKNKKDKIEVAADVKSVLVNGLVVEVWDFDGQIDKFESVLIQIKAQGGQIPDPEFTIVYDEEKEVYRFASSLQEINSPGNDLTVFKRKYSEIYDTRRTKYN